MNVGIMLEYRNFAMPCVRRCKKTDNRWNLPRIYANNYTIVLQLHARFLSPQAAEPIF